MQEWKPNFTTSALESKTLARLNRHICAALLIIDDITWSRAYMCGEGGVDISTREVLRSPKETNLNKRDAIKNRGQTRNHVKVGNWKYSWGNDQRKLNIWKMEKK